MAKRKPVDGSLRLRCFIGGKFQERVWTGREIQPPYPAEWIGRRFLSRSTASAIGLLGLRWLGAVCLSTGSHSNRIAFRSLVQGNAWLRSDPAHKRGANA